MVCGPKASKFFLWLWQHVRVGYDFRITAVHMDVVPTIIEPTEDRAGIHYLVVTG